MFFIPAEPVNLSKPVSLSKGVFTTAIGRAATMGAADGASACVWLADTNVPRETYRQWLTWINEGSPRQDEIPIPRPPISGEWADHFHVLDQIAAVTGWERDTEEFAEVIDAYAEGFDAAAWQAAEEIIAEYAELGTD